jgi:hypothetical protein
MKGDDDKDDGTQISQGTSLVVALCICTVYRCPFPGTLNSSAAAAAAGIPGRRRRPLVTCRIRSPHIPWKLPWAGRTRPCWLVTGGRKKTVETKKTFQKLIWEIRFDETTWDKKIYETNLSTRHLPRCKINASPGVLYITALVIPEMIMYPVLSHFP